MPSPNPLGNNPVTPPDPSDRIGGFFLRTIKGWILRQGLKYTGVAAAATGAWLSAKTGDSTDSTAVGQALGAFLTAVLTLGSEFVLSYISHNLPNESSVQ